MIAQLLENSSLHFQVNACIGVYPLFLRCLRFVAALLALKAGVPIANSRWSGSNIYMTITSFSSCRSFFELGWQLRWAGFPARFFHSIDSTTLYVAAARLTAGICECGLLR
jgi:hypothetical protein